MKNNVSGLSSVQNGCQHKYKKNVYCGMLPQPKKRPVTARSKTRSRREGRQGNNYQSGVSLNESLQGNEIHLAIAF